MNSDIKKVQGELRIMGLAPSDYSLYFTELHDEIKEIEIRFERPTSHIPSQIFKIKDLNILRLSNIKQLPDEIADLSQLRLLELIKFQQRSINPMICSLENLELLLIRRSNVEKLPENLPKLKNLRDIDLIGNNIPVVPSVLSELPNLKYLSLAGFWDTPLQLGEKLLRFTGLKKLFLGKFKEELFPEIWEAITALENLTHLTISGYNQKDMQILYVSPLINNLTKLESLWVDGSVMCFPDIPDLSNLTELYLTFTPLNSSSSAILESRQGVCINLDCELHKNEGDHR